MRHAFLLSFPSSLMAHHMLKICSVGPRFLHKLLNEILRRNALKKKKTWVKGTVSSKALPRLMTPPVFMWRGLLSVLRSTIPPEERDTPREMDGFGLSTQTICPINSNDNLNPALLVFFCIV